MFLGDIQSGAKVTGRLVKRKVFKLDTFIPYVIFKLNYIAINSFFIESSVQ